MRKIKKIADKVLVIISGIMVLVLSILSVAMPRPEILEGENRAPAPPPSLSPISILNGSFGRALEEYLKDGFPMREELIDLKAHTTLSLGMRENNGVIVGKQGYCAIRPDHSSLSLYSENLEHIKAFYSDCEKKGIPHYLFLAPRALDVLSHYFDAEELRGELSSVWDMAEESLPYLIEANEEIETQSASGEYVWFRSDHHWTSRGAYEAYLKIANALSVDAISMEELRPQILSQEFYGTVHSRLGLKGGDGDKLSVYRWQGDGEIAVYDHDTKRALTGLYDLKQLDEKDKYRVFLGGNHAHLSISSPTLEVRERIMIIKDSFANSVIPYLARDVDMEVYDLRYFKGSIEEEIARERPDRIILIYGIDTLLTDSSFALLGR